MNFKVFKKQQINNNTGFTIIELVVVFTVSAVIFGVVVSGYSDFSSKAELENIALDVALTIREAQVYGISVKEIGVGQFDLAYGVYFDIDEPNQFILFSDSVINNTYDTGEEISTFTVKSDYSISDLCITTVGLGQDCTIGMLSVIFRRPEPDAIFSPVGTLGEIEITSSKSGDTKIIRTTDTGQISVL